MARQREDPEAVGLLGAEVGEPVGAVVDDRRDRRDRLDVVDHRGAGVQTLDGRERRPVSRQPAVALERGEQRRLLAADIGARARVHHHVEAEAAAEDVLAQVARFVRLGHGVLQPPDDVQHLAADVDEGVARADREAGNDDAFDERVGVGHHQRGVLAGARLGLVRVDHQVVRPAVLGDEAPLHAGREARAAAAAQSGLLDRGDQVVRGGGQRLGQRPVAAGAAVALDRETVRLIPVGGEHGGQRVGQRDAPLVAGLLSGPSGGCGAVQPCSLAMFSPTRLAGPATGPSAARPSL